MADGLFLQRFSYEDQTTNFGQQEFNVVSLLLLFYGDLFDRWEFRLWYKLCNLDKATHGDKCSALASLGAEL